MSSTEPSDADPAVPDPPREDAPPRLVFRHSALGVLAAVLFLICALPLMLSVPFFWLVVLVPVGFVVWLVRVRTTVDAATVTTRTVVGTRSVAWDEITALRLGKRSGLTAVLGDDTALPLPAVHLRDLPALAVASGGRVPDPTAD